LEGVCDAEIHKLQEEFVRRKVQKLRTILAEGIALGQAVGLKVSDEALFHTAYLRKLYISNLYSFEPRPYLLSLLSSLSKTSFKLSLSAPSFHSALLSRLISQVLKAWLGLIETYESHLDSIMGVFLWVEGSFFVESTKGCEGSEKRVENLMRKIGEVGGGKGREKGVLKKQEESAMKSSFASLLQRHQVLLAALHHS
jgi:hypothetical protein